MLVITLVTMVISLVISVITLVISVITLVTSVLVTIIVQDHTMSHHAGLVSSSCSSSVPLGCFVCILESSRPPFPGGQTEMLL